MFYRLTPYKIIYLSRNLSMVMESLEPEADV